MNIAISHFRSGIDSATPVPPKRFGSPQIRTEPSIIVLEKCRRTRRHIPRIKHLCRARKTQKTLENVNFTQSPRGNSELAESSRLGGGAVRHRRNPLWRQNQANREKTGKSGALTLPSTHSRPNESHISAKGQDNAPPAQIWNRELSGNPSFGVTNCKPVVERRQTMPVLANVLLGVRPHHRLQRGQ